MYRSLIVIAALLAGCATDESLIDRQVGAHQPQEYKDGYGDGCDSGYVAAGNPYYKFRKDVTRYGADNLYKQGWDDGLNVCRSDYQSYRL